jgi:hypothetical protein
VFQLSTEKILDSLKYVIGFVVIYIVEDIEESYSEELSLLSDSDTETNTDHMIPDHNQMMDING